MSLPNFLRNLWTAIGSIFNHAEEEIRRVALPVAYGVVNALKVVTDLDPNDILGSIIGKVGTAGEDIIRKSLPNILLELKLIDATINAGDINAQLAAALNVLHLSSDRAKAAFYHNIGTMLLQDLSDGKLSISESITLIEYYVHNNPTPYVKPAPVVEIPVPVAETTATTQPPVVETPGIIPAPVVVPVTETPIE